MRSAWISCCAVAAMVMCIFVLHLYTKQPFDDSEIIHHALDKCETGNTMVLLGSHHKSGTVLTFHLGSLIYDLFENKSLAKFGYFIRRDGEMALMTKEFGVISDIRDAIACPCIKVAHVVRNPIELALSSYLYHKSRTQEVEPWLLVKANSSRYRKFLPRNSPLLRDTRNISYQEFLLAVSPEIGLRADAGLETMVNIPGMVEISKQMKSAELDLITGNLRKPSDKANQLCSAIPNCNSISRCFNGTSNLELRLEDFDSDFDTTVKRLYHFVGFRGKKLQSLVASAAQFDMQRSINTSSFEWKHATKGHQSETSRAELRQILLEITNSSAVYLDAMRELGYA